MASFGRDQQKRTWLPVAAAGVLWVAVVIVGGGVRSADPLLGVDNIDIVWTVILGLAVSSSLLLVLLAWLSSQRQEITEKEKRPTGVIALIVLVLLVMWWKPELFQQLINETEEEPVADATAPALEPVVDEPPVEVVAQFTDILLVLLGLGAIAAIWWFARRRIEEEIVDDVIAPVDAPIDAELTAAVDAMTLELRSGDDPRTTVVNAYAILESVLAQRGLARRATETHSEHIRRSLHGLTVDAEPFVELGGLYERARFSDQSISTAERDQAATALDAARTALIGPT